MTGFPETPEALVEHPAVDILTDRVAVVLQERPIVPLSTWLADTIVNARETGRGVQVVTPSTSRLTVPLAEVLRGDGARWVVRDGRSGTYFDGLRGHRLAWNGTVFDAAPGEEDGRRVGTVTGGMVRIEATVLHPATEALQIGRLAELCFSGLTGAGPRGWGVAEPATQPWSRTEVTAYCRRRAPAPSVLILVGGHRAEPAVGVLRVERRPAGVVEKLTLMVGTAEPDLDPIDRLATHLADARVATVRTMLAALHPGRSDCTIEPTVVGRPILYGMLWGPEAVAEHGTEHAAAAPAPHVEICGPADRPCCWCRFVGSDDHHPLTVFDAVYHHFT